MDVRTTKLLRGICTGLRDSVLPTLGDRGDVAEQVIFMIRVLRRLADTGDAIPGIASPAIAEFEQAISDAIPDDAAGLKLAVEQSRLEDDPTARITMLREIVVALMNDASVGAAELGRLAEADRQWCEDRARASDAHVEAPTSEAKPAHSVYTRVTSDSVTAYLRRRFPEEPGITATEVRVIPGGSSKKTITIALEGSDRFPRSIIMRQQDTGHVGFSLAEEFAVLDAMARSGAGLPLPDPLHFEEEQTELGGQFLLMKRLEGQVLGSFESFTLVSDAILRDLGTALAKFHALDPVALGLADKQQSADCGERLRASVRQQRTEWRENTVEPSPLITYTFDWLERESYQLNFPPSCVHGDVRAHNLLGTPDGLTGMLDWELFHLGDPAEDLAYLRPVVEELGLWPTFMGAYVAAGGKRYDEARLRIHAAAGLVRNCSFGAKSARMHLDGRVKEFRRGAVGHYAIPMLETLLADVFAGQFA